MRAYLESCRHFHGAAQRRGILLSLLVLGGVMLSILIAGALLLFTFIEELLG
jgi:hypothetical protein